MLKEQRHRLWPADLFLVACFGLLMAFTRSLFTGDTYWYVLDIQGALGHGWTDDPKIWDFSHLLWRPLGKILSGPFLPLILPHFHNNAATSITFLLVCLNVSAMLICGLLVQSAAWRLSGNRLTATWAAVAFLCISPLLNYSRSGSSYVFGLAFFLGAFYLSGFYQGDSRKAAVLCGILMSVAVLAWVPYLVSIPAVLLAGPLLSRDSRSERKRFMGFAVLAGLIAGVIVAGFYGVALGCLRVHTVSALQQWIHASSHDPDRNRKLLRMATGFPRSVYELGDVARWIKWYLFRDPYAQVGLLELMHVSLLKLAVFYVTLASLILSLWRSLMGRRLLVLLIIAMIPNLGMALYYESGSPERYLPFLPIVFIAFGYVLGSKDLSIRWKTLMALMCCAHIPVNLATLSASRVNRKFSIAADSLADLTQLRPGNHLYVINGSDDRAQLIVVAPFHPINQKSLPEFDTIMPTLGPRVAFWQIDFASTTLRTWDHSGEVWVTNRVLSQRPRRNWAWVEGDDKRITWKAIYEFFQGLDHSDTKGGVDGFFQIPNTPKNRSALLAVSTMSSGSSL